MSTDKELKHTDSILNTSALPVLVKDTDVIDESFYFKKWFYQVAIDPLIVCPHVLKSFAGSYFFTVKGVEDAFL